MIERSYHISDVVQEDFLRFPLSLLANPRYRHMSLEAKVMYSLLLNRLTLSQRHGWVNGENEVYLIYTREEAADVLGISYKKAIAAFKELIGAGLLYEQRRGRGYPNLLYLLKTELADTDAAEFSECMERADASAENVDDETGGGCNAGEPAANPDMPKSHIQTCRNGSSGYAVPAHSDMPKQQTSKTEMKKTENREIETSSFSTEDGELEEILERCELSIFREELRDMFAAAVERLYYSDSFRLGGANLPGPSIRRMLRSLTGDDLLSVAEAMRQNKSPVKNPAAYVMAMLLNQITGRYGSLILSLPAEIQTGSDIYADAPE